MNLSPFSVEKEKEGNRDYQTLQSYVEKAATRAFFLSYLIKICL